MTNKFYHGDTVLLEIQTGVWSPVAIVDIKFKFGKVYYRVCPIGGEGEMTVEQISVKKQKNGRT